MKLLKTTSLFLVLSFLSLFLLEHPANAQSETEPVPGWEGAWFYREKTAPVWFASDIDQQDVNEIKARWELIKKENHTNDIEGIYGVGGDTHAAYTAVSQKHGFVIIYVNLCAMMIHKASYGDVRFLGDQITFYPISKTSKFNGRHGETAGRQPFDMIRAKWRNVDYLLNTDEVESFCNGISGLDYPSSTPSYDFGSFFSSGTQNGSPYDLPILPENYRYLIRKSIVGKIIGVGKRKIEQYREEWSDDPHYRSSANVVINLGTNDGVKEGMRFYVLASNDCCIHEYFEISEVNQKYSVGVVNRDLEDKPEILYKNRKDSAWYGPLKNGLVVTTSFHAAEEYAYSFLDLDKYK